MANYERIETSSGTELVSKEVQAWGKLRSRSFGVRSERRIICVQETSEEGEKGNVAIQGRKMVIGLR